MLEFIDLWALPHVDAGYDVIGESGYIEGTRTGILKDIHIWSGDDTKFLLLFGALELENLRSLVKLSTTTDRK